jgi:hypothetical protein
MVHVVVRLAAHGLIQIRPKLALGLHRVATLLEGESPNETQMQWMAANPLTTPVAKC